jgi:hypothetical protein
MKLFDRHFCGDRCPIFIYHLHISRLTALLKFSVVLVLLLKEQAIFFTGINLFIVYSKSRHNLLRLV